MITQLQHMTPENTEFLILSFEGPDMYSLAGGLGVRVTSLIDALSRLGFTTHLIFVGDPAKKGQEIRNGGKLVLHRWCQWISQYHPEGVYQAENDKLRDFNQSVPPYVAEQIVRPAVERGKLVAILGEEWHTAEAMCRTSDTLYAMDLRDKVIMFWNANNTFSFHRIDWQRLAYTTTLTTVSRYMKHIMRGMGLNPLVIPNGIPESLLSDVNEDQVAEVRDSLGADLVLSKVARWDPDKGWNTAIEATAGLKARGLRTVLLARGGVEPYGGEVIGKARSLGLSVREAYARRDTLEGYLEAIKQGDHEDIVNLRFHCPQDFLRILYRASDGVLANSGHEPFGLVGLEAMAAGGIVLTGGTGEDYAIPFHNSIVLETAESGEMEACLMYLKEHPDEANRMRRAARETAAGYAWTEVAGILLQKLRYQARLQGALPVQKQVPSLGMDLLNRPEPMPERKCVLVEEARHDLAVIRTPCETLDQNLLGLTQTT